MMMNARQGDRTIQFKAFLDGAIDLSDETWFCLLISTFILEIHRLKYILLSIVGLETNIQLIHVPGIGLNHINKGNVSTVNLMLCKRKC